MRKIFVKGNFEREKFWERETLIKKNSKKEKYRMTRFSGKKILKEGNFDKRKFWNREIFKKQYFARGKLEKK